MIQLELFKPNETYTPRRMKFLTDIDDFSGDSQAREIAEEVDKQIVENHRLQES